MHGHLVETEVGVEDDDGAIEDVHFDDVNFDNAGPECNVMCWAHEPLENADFDDVDFDNAGPECIVGCWANGLANSGRFR